MGNIPMVFYQDCRIEASTVHNWHPFHYFLDYVCNLFGFVHYVDEIINAHPHSYTQYERI